MNATQTTTANWSPPSPYTPDAPGLPNYKATPAACQEKGKAERARRRACHGTVANCDSIARGGGTCLAPAYGATS